MVDSEHASRGHDMQQKVWGNRRFDRKNQSENNRIQRELYPEWHDKMINEHLFGEIASRPGGVPLREGAMVILTVGSIVVYDYDAVLRSQTGLAGNIMGALHVGISREEILEIFLLVAHYGGWPAAYNAMIVAKEIFAAMPPDEGRSNAPKVTHENNISDDEKYKKGITTLHQLEAGKVIKDFTEEFFPDFWKMTVSHVFGEVWSRPLLSLRERILICLVVNITLKFNFGIEMSMRWALNNGFSQQEILEVLLQVATFRGWPAGNNAIRVAKKVFSSMK